MKQNNAHIQIRNLQRRFGDAVALDGVDLDVAAGEVIAVLGSSGCGKSTLLRLIAGLDEPSGGSINIGGATVSCAKFTLPPERRPVNMVFQDFALWPHMTVGEIIRFGMRYRKIPKKQWRERLDQLLALLELEGLERRYPRQLSGGQQQRVAIARALATDPQLLLLDEPLSNLDSQLRLQMRDELAALLRRVGTTAIYVTHDLQEALTLGDRLVVMRHGQVEQFGSAHDVFARPATPWVAGLVGFSNSMPVTVESVANDSVKVRHGEQTLRVEQFKHGLERGHQATLMVQPQALSLGDSFIDRENFVRGIVKSCHYEGLRWRLRCDVEGRALTVHSDQPAEEGQPVSINFPVQHSRVYAS